MNARDRNQVIELLVEGRWYEDLACVIDREESPRRLLGRVVSMRDPRSTAQATLWECGPIYSDAQLDLQYAENHLRKCCALWIVDYLEIDGPRTVGGAGAQPPAADHPPPERVEPAAVRGEFEARNPPDNPLEAAEGELAQALRHSNEASDAIEAFAKEGSRRSSGAALAALNTLCASIGLVLGHALVSIRTSQERCDPRSGRTLADLNAQIAGPRLVPWPLPLEADACKCFACGRVFYPGSGEPPKWSPGAPCPACNAWRKASG